MKTPQDPEAAETVQTKEIPAVAPAATCSTHLAWSTEKNGACPECSGKTVLIIARAWEADSENESHPDIAGEWVEVEEEITGHWCPECCALRSISFNS